MQTWFRFYNEVKDDPKVQKLPPVLFKVWVNLMCIASDNQKRRGSLPDIGDVAYTLRVSVLRAEEYLKQLVDADLFEWKDGVAWSHNWKGRQFSSDVSTDRVKQFRERHKGDTGNVGVNVSGNVSATASVTLPDTDTDTDTEQIQNREEKAAAASFDFGAAFEIRWARYPNKDGRKDAERHWKASVKTGNDLASFDQALDKYLDHLRVTGYPPKNGKTFFNNWHDWINWVEPERNLFKGNGNGTYQQNSPGRTLPKKQWEPKQRG